MNKLNELIQEFNDEYSKLLDVQSQQIIERLAEERQATFKLLEGKEFKDQFTPKVDRAFQELKEKIEQANTTDDLVFLLINVTEQYSIFNHQFDQEENRRRIEEQARKQREEANVICETTEKEPDNDKKIEVKPVDTPIVQRKTVPLRTLNIHAKTIKSPSDIDALTDEINRKLREQLEENTEITIQF